MISIAVVALQIAACLGAGAVALKMLGLSPVLSAGERMTWSFATGFGVIGWILFFIGAGGGFSAGPLLILLVVSSVGCVYLLPLRLEGWRLPTGLIGRTLTVLLMLVLAVDFVEALAPPADADSLAYHFALPKQFLEAGRLVFVPRVADGAIPLLVHMTYVPALGLGGERGLTLWAMITGWAVAALLYETARRFMDSRWALAATLVFLTTPAIVYSGGSGHVEVRNGLFALVAAASIADGVTKDRPSSFLLAGLAAGFFAAGKYFGLFFVAAAGLATLLRGRRIVQATLFSTGALVAGFQWYFWNWLHTGDPLFPVLIDRFGIGDTAFWPRDFALWFAETFFVLESAVPANLLWLVLYPIKATFAGAPVFESGRTGLGVMFALLMPFAALAAWRSRARIVHSPLAMLLFAAFAYYVIWFMVGTSQRVRHLVPVFPIVLVVASAAVVSIAEDRRMMILIASAFALTISIQLLGLGVYARNYVQHVVARESREAFLKRNVIHYDAVAWVNGALSQNDRVFTLMRQAIYLFDVPVYHGNLNQDPIVEVRPSTSPERLVAQLRAQGITHLLIGGTDETVNLISTCLDVVRRFEMPAIGSRSLGTVEGVAYATLFRLEKNCPYG